MKKYLVLVVHVLFVCCDKANYNQIINDDCQGIIKTIYKDMSNHAVLKFEIEYFDSQSKEREVVADFYPKSWEYAVVGDSIIKNKGESFITIKKADGSFRVFETRIKK